jgi:hypothetical protein
MMCHEICIKSAQLQPICALLALVEAAASQYGQEKSGEESYSTITVSFTVHLNSRKVLVPQ